MPSFFFSTSTSSFHFNSTQLNWTYGCLPGFCKGKKRERKRPRNVWVSEWVNARARVFFPLFQCLRPFAFWRWQLHVPQFPFSFSYFVRFLFSFSCSWFFKSSKNSFFFSLFNSHFIAENLSPLHQIGRTHIFLMCLMCFAVRKENYLHHRLNVPLNQSDLFYFLLSSIDDSIEHTRLVWLANTLASIWIGLCVLCPWVYLFLLVGWHDERL